MKWCQTSTRIGCKKKFIVERAMSECSPEGKKIYYGQGNGVSVHPKKGYEFTIKLWGESSPWKRAMGREFTMRKRAMGESFTWRKKEKEQWVESSP